VTTFVAVALAGAMSIHASPEQSATRNPCVVKGKTSPRLLPVDDAPSDPKFLEYRTRLLMAVERRDIDAVVEAMDPDIKLDFGGTSGVDSFRKAVVERPEAWEEMRWVLAHGGSFMGENLFAAPYVYARWPDELDSFECAAITGRNVRLRSAPRLDAPVITSLSYSIVHASNDEVRDPVWKHVQLGGGRTGYVWHAYVRRPIEHRALFNLIDGRWRMTAFVAGD
jgi:hypothetical protein